MNDAPTLKILHQFCCRRLEFAHQFEFSDEEDGSENLLFEITDAPEWMSVLSGLLTGTPDNEDVGIIGNSKGHRQVVRVIQRHLPLQLTPTMRL